ncbi:MAG: hypothetical protein ACJ8DX_04015 [Xanthobacteraceae bacterium]
MNRKLGLLFLAVATTSAIVFLAALHPASGALGGLMYLLTFWALPSILVVALAFGLAWLIPAPVAVRIVVAFILSFLLGVNTSLPVLADIVRYKPLVSSEVRRAVAWSAERRPIAVKSRPWGPGLVVPFGPRVRVGSDEGCGCMYFLDAADALYSDRVIATLSAAVGRRGTVMDYAQSDPAYESKDVHIDLTLWRHDDGFRALIEVFDRGEKIAAFAHTQIPLRALTERAGVGRERLGENFFENALDILLHDNVFSHALNAAVPPYFPERELYAFFLQVSGTP